MATRKKRLPYAKYWDAVETKWGSLYQYPDKPVPRGYSQSLVIICPVHGEVEMTFYTHLHATNGCNKCGLEQRGKAGKTAFQSTVTETNKTEVYKARATRDINTLQDHVVKRFGYGCKSVGFHRESTPRDFTSLETIIGTGIVIRDFPACDQRAEEERRHILLYKEGLIPHACVRRNSPYQEHYRDIRDGKEHTELAEEEPNADFI